MQSIQARLFRKINNARCSLSGAPVCKVIKQISQKMTVNKFECHYKNKATSPRGPDSLDSVSTV